MSNYNQTTVAGNHPSQQAGTVPSAPDGEYEWILNEDLLRDEGVIYGLTDSNVEQKTSAIVHFYDIQIEVEKARADALENEAARIYEAIETLEKRLVQLQEDLATLSSSAHFSAHHFFRSALGVSAYGLACGLVYLAVLEWTGPLWQAPAAVTAGVYIFGALSLFNKQSILYQKDEEQIPLQRERWKIIVEEFIIPLAAAAFIISWRAKPAAPEQIVAFGLLLYLLFLFGGKGFMSSLFLLKADIIVLYNDFLKNKWRRNQIKQIKEVIQAEKKAKLDCHLDLLSTYVHTQEIDKSVRKLEATKNAKIAYFLSEYELAKSARNYMTNEQMILMGMHKKSS